MNTNVAGGEPVGVHNRARSLRRARLLPLTALASVFTFALGCASVRSAPVAASDPGSVEHVLAACSDGDASFCSGFVEAAFSAVSTEGSLCPPPLTDDEVVAVVVEALRHSPLEGAAFEPVRAALVKAWGCPAVPAPQGVTT